MTTIRTILHPTDFSGASEAAHRVAVAIARDFGAGLLVLHAWQPPPVIHCRAGAVPVGDFETNHSEAKSKLEKWRADDRAPVDERLVTEGSAGDAILRVARDRHCDLIVMGTHGRTGLDRLVLGSVAEHVTRRALCPVITVRQTGEDYTPV